MMVDERKSVNNTNMNNANNYSGSIIQNLILESREKLSISGVLDVLSFDDQVVIVQTELRTTYY